jgi:peptide/nickel transport system ATP-binding protein
MSNALLAITDLDLAYRTPAGPLTALSRVALSVEAGQTVAVVGESGSGKSTIAFAVMGLLGREAAISGSIRLEGRELVGLGETERRGLRGRAAGMVFQDPFTSLNPSLTIGRQMAEPLIVHRRMTREDARVRAVAALGEVGLPSPADLMAAYPHQLSGGMQQRVLIANAIVCDPKLLILDEPTTALDVTVEAQILDLLDRLKRDRGLGLLFITHNLGVVNRIADRVCVLYAGRVVEFGTKGQVLGWPSHPYAKGLLASLPRLSSAGRHERISPIPGRFPDLLAPPPGCIFADRCPFVENRCRTEPQTLRATEPGHEVRCWKSAEVPAWPRPPDQGRAAVQKDRDAGIPLLETQDLSKSYRRTRVGGGWRWERRFGILPWPSARTEAVQAVDDISLTIGRGEILGLVGESGSGKSTFGRTVLRLVDPSGGKILFDGADIATVPERELASWRKLAQIVFQNPDSSLNPRRRVGDAIARAVALHTNVAPSRRRSHVETLLDRVGLPRSYYDRFPHQLSGGEKQRVGIARAIATEPEFIVCDEPVSALDVSVQATVLNLLDSLRDELGLSYLFISHDLSVVAYIADRIAVLYAGRICEIGPATAVLNPPYHPYTQVLLSSVPNPDVGAGAWERVRPRGDAPVTRERRGCVFHTRCPYVIAGLCETVPPPTLEPRPGHRIACHLPIETLAGMPSAIPAAAMPWQAGLRSILPPATDGLPKNGRRGLPP